MSKLILEDDMAEKIRGFTLRLFYLAASMTLLSMLLDLSIVLGDGPKVANPFAPAAYSAAFTCLLLVIMYATRHSKKDEFERTSR